MGVYVAGEAPKMDRLVAETIKAMGAEIESLRVPRLQGVVLGGGYGRGEGGVRSFELGGEGGEAKAEEALSNDLDFFAVTEEGASAPEIAAIGAALEPVSRRWTERLGVDVDFTVRTPWRLRHDQVRVMIQELIHGYFDVAGKKGAEMFKGIEDRPPSAFPWSEAVRLLVNRGVGLLLAYERIQSATRNGQDARCPSGSTRNGQDARCPSGSTLNSQPSTLNSQLSTLNSQLSTLNHQLPTTN